MALEIMPGLDINLVLLLFICLCAGVLSGFAGVGGAFILMPALIILGVPADLAVGTSITWVLGNSVIGLLKHRSLGNVDLRLGAVLVAASLGGVEVGTRLINLATSAGMGEQAVLGISLVIQLIVGVYTLYDCLKKKAYLDRLLARGAEIPPDLKGTGLSQKLQSINLPPSLYFPQSGVRISLWIVLAAGFFGGVIVGAIGVGGGFIMVPVMIYFIGMSSFMAVGTSLFQIIFASAYGSFRNSLNGSVMIFTAIIMLITSSIGIQLGALVTRYVHGLSVRLVLGSSITMAAIGVALKLCGLLFQGPAPAFDAAAVAVTFGGTGLMVLLVVLLLIMARRYRKGQYVPAGIVSLVCKSGE